MNESKENPSRTGININIFDATTSKFLTSQTFNYKARHKKNSLGDNRSGKKANARNHSIIKIDINSKNQFSSLMVQDMVLDDTKNQASEKLKK